jgi:hypothetical protein
MGLTDDQLAFAKTILLSGQASDYYWTAAWNNYKNDPNATNKNIVLSRLQYMYKYLMNQAEYQLS